MMPWTNKKPTVDESEEYVRQAAANWILTKDEEPYLPKLEMNIYAIMHQATFRQEVRI